MTTFSPAHPEHPLTIEPVNPGCTEARILIEALDTEIASLYPGSTIVGIDPAEFERAGGYFVIARREEVALGCGGFRPLDARCVEIKRMFVRPDVRRQGIGRQILKHLEEEIRRRCYSSMVLETGCHNTQARSLYEAEGYRPIPAFRGYVGIPISRCYSKET